MLGKKGMEISINVIVMIILGIIMFGAAMAIFNNVYSNVVDLEYQVSEQIRDRTIRNFPSDQLVYLPETNKAPARRLFRTENQVVFYVGIYNNYTETKEFHMNIEPTSASQEVLDNRLTSLETVSIPQRQQDVHFFIVDVEGLERGQYGIIVNVTTDDGIQHGRTRIAYVNLN